MITEAMQYISLVKHLKLASFTLLESAIPSFHFLNTIAVIFRYRARKHCPNAPHPTGLEH